MDHIGAGLAALGVFGPGIGIGILGGLASTAIGRNPEAAGQIRGLAIILAAFAEGLGVLAIVVGILAIVHLAVRRRSNRGPAFRRRCSCPGGVRLAADEPATGGLTINLFWIIVSALNFIVFFVLFKTFALAPLTKMLNDRRERIAQGLADAEQARTDREASVAERQADPGRGSPRGQARSSTAPRRSPRRSRDADIAATTSRARADARAGGGRDRGREAAGVARPARRGRQPGPVGGRPGRRRDDERPAPAAPRRGVPGQDRHVRPGLPADGPSLDGGPALRRVRLRDRQSRQVRRSAGGAELDLAPPRSSATRPWPAA